MTGSDILYLLEEEYFDKILGFCCLKMNTREEAEDLAQDIALELLKTVRSGKPVENLGAFCWRVSNNIFLKRIRGKKYGATVYLPDYNLASADNTEEEYIRREQENLLRREIALLSEHYRKAVIMYYFDGKSVAEIAEALRKSPGTVKWWLHDARNLLKEGIHTMREFGERSFKPESLILSCKNHPGADGEPMSCVKRKSTQNILLAAYYQPLTVEELCIELGISAPYIEDEVEYLVENQLMRKVGSDRYQTDFVIYSPIGSQMNETICNSCFPAFFNDLITLLEENRPLLESLEYNTPNFTWERLLWIYIHMFTWFMESKYRWEECLNSSAPEVPERPNGGNWIAFGFRQIPEQKSRIRKPYEMWDGPVHKVYHDFIQGFYHYWNGMDSTDYFAIPNGVFELCREVVTGTIAPDTMNDDQKYLFSIALDKKLFLREGDTFRQNYYFIDRKHLSVLEIIADEAYPQFKKYFDIAYAIILKERAGDIPKHLQKDAVGSITNSLTIFVTRSLYEAEQRGLLSVPTETDRDWLSLYATEA